MMSCARALLLTAALLSVVSAKGLAADAKSMLPAAVSEVTGFSFLGVEEKVVSEATATVHHRNAMGEAMKLGENAGTGSDDMGPCKNCVYVSCVACVLR